MGRVLLCFLMLSAQIHGEGYSTGSVPPQIIDLGTEGHVFEIAEENLIEVIQNKLKRLERSGDLEALQRQIQEKSKQKILSPKPVTGLQKAEETVVRTFDPSYRVKSNFMDSKGVIFARKGDIINPLEKVSFGEPMLFIDGEDPDQIAYARSKIHQRRLKIVLVAGRPVDLSKDLNQPIYFDQGGHLTKKLHLMKVPSLVYQEGPLLKIKEVKV